MNGQEELYHCFWRTYDKSYDNLRVGSLAAICRHIIALQGNEQGEVHWPWIVQCISEEDTSPQTITNRQEAAEWLWQELTAVFQNSTKHLVRIVNNILFSISIWVYAQREVLLSESFNDKTPTSWLSPDIERNFNTAQYTILKIEHFKDH